MLLPHLLQQRASLNPDAVALAVDGGDSLTWRQWEERATATARGLAGHDVTRGDRVALVFDNRRWLDLAVAYLGVLRAGAVAVPMTRRFPALDMARVLGDCEPTLVVGPPDLMPPDLQWPRATLEELQLQGPADPGPGPSGPFKAGGIGLEDPAAVADLLYPAGAMRRPVARAFTHAQILSPPDAFSGIGPGPFVHAFPIGGRAGQEAIRLPLRKEGGRAIAVVTLSPRDFAARARRLKARTWGMTPAMARSLVASHPPGDPLLPAGTRIVLSPPPRSEITVPRAEVRHLPDPAGVAPPERAELAPLAAAQDGMVWHEQFTPGSFNLSPPVRRYRGALDVVALEAALSEIVRRHPALRTTFTVVDGRGTQVFTPPRPLALPVVDLSGLPPDEQRARLSGLVIESQRRPFDLVQGPLFAPTLVRLGADDHVVVIRTHHAVYDDWSVGIFRQELSALYSAYATGQASPLPEPRAHLPEVIRAQDEGHRGQAGDADRTFWRTELEGAPLSVQLPIDDPDRPVGSPHTAPPPLSLDLPAELSDALRALARRQRATPFIVLLAAFGVLVQRYTGQSDLLVSTLAANRPTTETEGLIGCFGKKVLVRLRLSDDPPFPDLVTRTRRAVMGALAHQGLAYEAVVQEFLGPPAVAHGLSPQIALKFQAAITSHQRLSLPGLKVTGIDLPPPPNGVAHFLSGDSGEPKHAHTPEWGGGLYAGAFLGISVVESGPALRFVTEGVFHAPEVERLLAHFEILLTDIVGDPDRPVSTFRLLDGRERPAPSVAASAPGPSGPVRAGDPGPSGPVRAGDPGPSGPVRAGDPGPSALYEAFAGQARRVPDRVAVVAGDERLTWAELNQRANRPAAGSEACDTVVRAIAAWRAGHALDGLALEPADLLLVGSALGSAVYPADGRLRRIWVPPDPGSGPFVRALMALLSGHSLHLAAVPPAGDPGHDLSLLAGGTVDVLDCRPGDLDALIDAGLQPAIDRRGILSAPRPLILVATEVPIPPEWWSRWQGIRGADIRVLFGPAECGFAATAGRVTDGPARPGIGRPLPGLTVEVVDSAARPAPWRAVGTLRVSGPRPGRTVHLHHVARARPDGTLELVGGPGAVDMRGFLVEPARVEAALHDCPGVAGIAVRERDGSLIADVVPEDPAAPPTLQALRRWLWKRLPGYAWPAAMAGERAWPDQPPKSPALTGPLGPGEAAAYLGAALAEAAGTDVADPAENYWQSFALLEVLAEMAQCGNVIPPRQVMRNRTVEMLATDLAAGDPSDAGPSGPVRAGDAEPGPEEENN